MLLVVLFSSCGYFYNHISISGSAVGINSGDVIIKDQSGEVVFGVPIKNGKFYITKQKLPLTGYYNLYIASSANPFEVYLEPGVYTIKTSLSKINDYPLITTSSEIQKELGDFHRLADKAILKANATVNLLADSMADVNVSPAKYNIITNNLKSAQVVQRNASFNALKLYLSRYPENEVIAHLVANINYENDPAKFYNLYNKFSVKARNSNEGTIIGKRLSVLIKLMPGMLAPPLEGRTPENKIIDLKSLNKKFVVVEFWRASLPISRLNHRDFMLNVFQEFKDKGVGIISVSLDKKADWWKQAIKDDKMTWSQLSDLKGVNSPNIANWAVNVIPMYCILDGQGHILDRNLPCQNIASALKIYIGN